MARLRQVPEARPILHSVEFTLIRAAAKRERRPGEEMILRGIRRLAMVAMRMVDLITTLNTQIHRCKTNLIEKSRT